MVVDGSHAAGEWGHGVGMLEGVVRRGEIGHHMGDLANRLYH